jgi:hypothetical protein
MNEQLQRNQRLKPFGELLHEMYEKTRSILETKSDDELLKIIEDTKNLNVQNCWWAVYNMREIVAYEAKIILQNRQIGLEEPNHDT